MTKADLIRVLEPFTDDLPISILGPDGIYVYEPRIFYCMNDGEDSIILSTHHQPKIKAVELKV